MLLVSGYNPGKKDVDIPKIVSKLSKKLKKFDKKSALQMMEVFLDEGENTSLENLDLRKTMDGIVEDLQKKL